MNEDGKIREFTDLVVWQKGHELVIEIYKITKEFPKEELYSLTNQMRRSAMSITPILPRGSVGTGTKKRFNFTIYRTAHLQS